MKWDEFLKGVWEEGYYYCEDCGVICFVCDDDEFEDTNHMKRSCSTCKDETIHYPIIEPTFDMIRKLLLKENESETGGENGKN